MATDTQTGVAADQGTMDAVLRCQDGIEIKLCDKTAIILKLVQQVQNVAFPVIQVTLSSAVAPMVEPVWQRSHGVYLKDLEENRRR